MTTVSNAKALGRTLNYSVRQKHCLVTCLGNEQKRPTYSEGSGRSGFGTCNLSGQPVHLAAPLFVAHTVQGWAQLGLIPLISVGGYEKFVHEKTRTGGQGSIYLCSPSSFLVCES